MNINRAIMNSNTIESPVPILGPATDQSMGSHLNPYAAKLLLEPVEVRLRRVFEDKFVLHSQAKAHLTLLKEALTRPACERPSCYALIGDSNCGKTAIINRLYRDLGGDPATRAGAADRMPILVVELPPRATEPSTVLAMGRALRLPIVSEAQSRKVTDIVLRKLKERRVRMVILLEFDHIAPVGKAERAVLFNLLKTISNEGTSVVVVGTRACSEYLHEDEQIVSRLRPLYIHGFANDQAYVDFVGTLETFYPFPSPSYLWRDHIDTIFRRTSGVLGETVYLLNEAAAWSLRNKLNNISQEALLKCSYIESLAAPARLKK